MNIGHDQQGTLNSPTRMTNMDTIFSQTDIGVMSPG